MKTWLITGASSGLGLAMSRRLLDRGDRVVAAVRRSEPLSDLKSRYPERLEVRTFDLTDTAALRREIDAAFTGGRIDVVVSNAGYGLFGAAEEATDAQIDRQIATNLVGSIQLIRAALPHLRGQGGGLVQQVSSEGGQVAYPAFSLYHATKWGIEGFVESVAQEVAPFGVRFTLVEPGPTATGFGAGLDRTAPMAVYDATPAGDVRRAIVEGGFEIRGDADRTVEAMIVAADADDPPRRLALGSTAFENIEAALAARIAELRARRDVAHGADRS